MIVRSDSTMTACGRTTKTWFVWIDDTAEASSAVLADTARSAAETFARQRSLYATHTIRVVSQETWIRRPLSGPPTDDEIWRRRHGRPVIDLRDVLRSSMLTAASSFRVRIDVVVEAIE